MPEITINRGDTLWALANKYGTSVQKLAESNGIANPDLIMAGAKLKLPADSRRTGGNNPNSGSQLQLPPAATPAATPATPPGPDAPANAPAPGQPATAGDVPYLNQNTDSLYNNGSNCGPTSMAMIARAFGYGQGMSNGQLIADMGKAGGTTADGTSWSGIKGMAQRMGKNCEEHGPDTNWIAQQLKAGKLVCCNGDYFAMPPHNAAKTGQGGHYVAITGMDANGNFLVNDPADASIHGKAFTSAQIQAFMRGNTNGGQAFAIG